MVILDIDYINEAATKLRLSHIYVNGKKRTIHFNDRYKNYSDRKFIYDEVISEIKAAIRNEKALMKKIYETIIDEDPSDSVREDAENNDGYLDWFEIYEDGNGYSLCCTMNNYQYMLTNIMNGKVTSKSKVVYLD